jgi:hypothetical protein
MKCQVHESISIKVVCNFYEIIGIIHNYSSRIVLMIGGAWASY